LAIKKLKMLKRLTRCKQARQRSLQEV